jgi:hypothetical protein
MDFDEVNRVLCPSKLKKYGNLERRCGCSLSSLKIE